MLAGLGLNLRWTEWLKRDFVIRHTEERDGLHRRTSGIPWDPTVPRGGGLQRGRVCTGYGSHQRLGIPLGDVQARAGRDQQGLEVMTAVVPRLPAAKQRREVSVKIPYTCSKAAASTSPPHLPKSSPATPSFCHSNRRCNTSVVRHAWDILTPM